jgi:hypothetical protein
MESQYLSLAAGNRLQLPWINDRTLRAPKANPRVSYTRSEAGGSFTLCVRFGSVADFASHFLLLFL